MKAVKASRLTERMSFHKREEVDDGYGNTVGEMVKQSECLAEFVHLRGSEEVMAGRLQGTHTQLIRVRRSRATEAVNTDWAVKDERRGTWFNIRDITLLPDRRTIDILAQAGVAI